VDPKILTRAIASDWPNRRRARLPAAVSIQLNLAVTLSQLHCTAPWIASISNAQRYEMALPLCSGLSPSEVGFLCEMEQVTVIPRQKLDGLELLGVSAP
jgi:hypothetical protein